MPSAVQLIYSYTPYVGSAYRGAFCFYTEQCSQVIYKLKGKDNQRRMKAGLKSKTLADVFPVSKRNSEQNRQAMINQDNSKKITETAFA